MRYLFEDLGDDLSGSPCRTVEVEVYERDSKQARIKGAHAAAIKLNVDPEQIGFCRVVKPLSDTMAPWSSARETFPGSGFYR